MVKLRAQLSEELSKPVCHQKSFICSKNAIELLVSMVEMAHLVDAQLEAINQQTNFDRARQA